MNIEQLNFLYGKRENVEIEYKSAAGGFPKEFWPTFSSFANTNGGVIVLGVREKNNLPVIDNLSEDNVEKLKRDFWNTVNSKQKVNNPLLNDDDVREYQLDNGSWVLIFEIPRADYNQKPIYLDGNPLRGTYKRRHEGDYHCSEEEVKQMMSDANHLTKSFDGRILRGYGMEDIDQSTFSRFRREFNAAKKDHQWIGLSDLEFMKRIGGYRKDRITGEEGFTVAGLLMFGKTESINDQGCLPYFYVDYREHLSDIEGERWSDRIYPDGRWEANAYLFFLKVLDRLYDALPKPFRITDNGVTRLEYTSAHYSVREALANAIIHASYSQRGSIVIDRWKDYIEISNPGSMLVSVNQFYQGQQSICRNPYVQRMFVALGIGEKAGSGAEAIMKGWSDNEWERPVIEECYEPDYVKITLRLKKVSLSQSLSQSPSQSLSWSQVGTKLTLSWGQVESLMKKMQEETLAKDLRVLVGMKDSTYFKKNYLDPLMEIGVVAMTIPEKPTSPNQKYFLTEKGRQVLKYELRKLVQPEGVSSVQVERLIAEIDEALPKYPIGLPKMRNEYLKSLPVTDVRCFQSAYKLKKEMFTSDSGWVYDTPELYLREIQVNIWQHYNIQFLMHKSDATYQIHFSEIKRALKVLGIDGNYAVIASFDIGTYDDLYGGEVPFNETKYGFQYGDISIYRIPSHDAHLIVMRNDNLPRTEAKVFEGGNEEFKLINEDHLLYSNLYNMKDIGDELGLAMMRDIKFYYPENCNFKYVRIDVDRLENTESDLDKIEQIGF